MARRIKRDEPVQPLVIELTPEEVQWLHAFVRESDGTRLTVLYEIFDTYLQNAGIDREDKENPIPDRVVASSVRELIARGFIYEKGTH